MGRSEESCDLFVAGAGFAGMAAALFAASRGLSVAVAGMVGGIDFTTGFLDLMAVHPVAQGRVWDDPWQAIQALVRDEPRHPYALVPQADIRAALDEFTAFLARAGFPYRGRQDRNVRVLTAAGTAKVTFRVPASMWNGALALEEDRPCLVVGVKGLRGFSARQICQVQAASRPGLRPAVVDPPFSSGEVLPERLAEAMAEAASVETLARAVAPHLGDAWAVGFPSALGLFGRPEVQQRLEGLLGRVVFEIPTLPPSIAGRGLRTAFERGLPDLGATMLSQQLALAWERVPDGRFRIRVGVREPRLDVLARGVILAGGRFFGKGLVAGRSGVREPLFNLPVTQPEDREQWHRQDPFDPRGHPLNRAGVEVDGRLRPLGADGRPLLDNLFAAGAILAHQDWARMKCGAGLAVSTAYAAVQSFLGAKGRTWTR